MEKGEVPNTFFALLFYGKASYSPGTEPFDLEDRDGEQNKASEEMVSDLPHYLDTHKSMGPGGSHPKVLRELVNVLTETFSIIYLVNQGDPMRLEVGRCDACLQKGQKEDPGNCRSVSLTSVLLKVME